MPETWMRTPFAVTIPAASRWKWLDELMSRAGITPSMTARCSPYTSARNFSSARTRCLTPDSTVSHSSCWMTRGTASSGNGRSSPAKSNVTPCAR